MKKAWYFICNNAYAVMMVGFITGLAGLLTLMRLRQTGVYAQYPLVLGVAGIVIYILGRIALVGKGKMPKRPSESNSDDQEDNDL